ncbi:unnamed protein product [Oikopleura dioica]|uniref:Uncharacterized protein n=1 Tax=Oikopleura dioica TaxID=34765 RepID=E4Y556_OIKDI|nr:unnamed protein product [Oikopleura dioica]
MEKFRQDRLNYRTVTVTVAITTNSGDSSSQLTKITQSA